jgi:hypothetical protein
LKLGLEKQADNNSKKFYQTQTSPDYDRLSFKKDDGPKPVRLFDLGPP